jgi:hypothetical protein
MILMTFLDPTRAGVGNSQMNGPNKELRVWWAKIWFKRPALQPVCCKDPLGTYVGGSNGLFERTLFERMSFDANLFPLLVDQDLPFLAKQKRIETVGMVEFSWGSWLS